jgi:two-component system, cell cycle response regulator
MPRLTRKVFWDLGLWMGGFGLVVGLVFPFFAIALGVPSPTALGSRFIAACVTAGLAVGGVNFALARWVVGARLRVLAARMSGVADSITDAMYQQEWSGCTERHCKVPEDSTDELGHVAEAFNHLIDALERFRWAQEAVVAVTATLGRHLRLADLAASCLRRVCEYTGADGAVLLAGAPGRFEEVGRVGAAGELHIAVDEAALGRGISRRTCGDGGETIEVPIEVNDMLVGIAVLTRRAPFEPAVERLLAAIRPSIGMALENVDAHARMRRLACEDGLTGLCNRRHALEVLEQVYTDAMRARGSVGVLLFDVDRFKGVNDRHGHAGGDAVLRTIADTARRCVRRGDLVARYGGEEFLVLLPGATPDDVIAIGERLRAEIEAMPTALPTGLLSVTVSIGAAVVPKLEVTDLDSLLRAADDALYRAKAEGRNRLVVA